MKWFKWRRDAPSAECRRIAQMLQLYLDGEGTPEGAARVQLHLDECGACGLEAEALSELKEAVRRHGNSDGEAKQRLREFAERLSRGEIDTADEPSY